MTSAKNITAYILEKKGAVTTWKLQKLVYYCQAWSLVWDDEALFNEQIEAWINGPVCPALYELHRGQFRISEIETGDASALSKVQKETVDAVLRYYGDRSPQWLSNLTHMEAPWQEARKGIPPRVRGNSVISLESMAEYYESLTEEDRLSE